MPLLYPNENLLVWLLWIHFSFIFVPTIGMILKFEYDEWKEKKPRTIRLRREEEKDNRRHRGVHILRPIRH